MSDTQIEQEIQAKGLTALRVIPADLEANIVEECYFTAAQGFRKAREDAGHASHDVDAMHAECRRTPQALYQLTFCVLILRNGFTVTGASACASPENFNAEIGQKIARENAVREIWPLMGYELRSKLTSQ